MNYKFFEFHSALLLLLLIIFGCNENNSINDELKQACSPNETELQWKPTDTISITLDESVSSLMQERQLFTDRGQEFMAYTDMAKRCIYVCNLSEEQSTKAICLNDFRFKKFNSFYLHNQDSIFLSVGDFDLLLIDGDGNRVSYMPLADKLLNNDFESSLDVFSHHLYFDPSTQLLHATVLPTALWTAEEKAHFRNRVCININTSEVNYYGGYAGVYQRVTHGNYYPSLFERPSMQLVGKKAYISLPLSHSVQVYDYIADSSITASCVPSTLFDFLPEPLAEGSESQEELNFSITQPYYSDLFYHSKLGLFSRVARGGISLLNPQGNRNPMSSRDNEIIFFDKQLNLLGKINGFGKGVPVASTGALATPDGFLIQIPQAEESNKVFVKVEIIRE